MTSGRKLRTYSGMEIFKITTFLISNGRRSVENRHDFWYGPRREDPIAAERRPDPEAEDRALSA